MRSLGSRRGAVRGDGRRPPPGGTRPAHVVASHLPACWNRDRGGHGRPRYPHAEGAEGWRHAAVRRRRSRVPPREVRGARSTLASLRVRGHARDSDYDWDRPARRSRRDFFCRRRRPWPESQRWPGFVGRVEAHGRAAIDAARKALRLGVTRPTEPAGVAVGVKGIAPWITSQSDFYRIDTALAIPEILPQGLVAAHPRNGRPRAHPELRRPRGPRVSRRPG